MFRKGSFSRCCTMSKRELLTESLESKAEFDHVIINQRR